MLFLLLSEFNSCIELSKTLRIFGINVSHDTINRILWNEGLNPQEKLFNFVKNFITPEYDISVIDDFVIDKFYSKSTETSFQSILEFMIDQGMERRRMIYVGR